MDANVGEPQQLLGVCGDAEPAESSDDRRRGILGWGKTMASGETQFARLMVGVQAQGRCPLYPTRGL